MVKKLCKTTAVLVILSFLLMMGSFTALGAAKPTADSVTPGRTILNVQTGVITPNSVTIPQYAASTTLSGTVVIDGPKLVLKVNGVDVTAAANVVKVSDKIWTYSYTYQFNQAVGDININLEAYTVYINGKTAGNIHTQAAPVSQIIHVPYVKSFEYTNLTWDSYDRVTNVFSLSYNLVKVWDDGERVTDDQKTVGAVEGTAVYTLTASDPTHNGGVPDAFGTITPPVVFRNFSYPASSAEYTWTYDDASKTYSVSFTVVKLWSNGTTATETFTQNGLTPGASNTIMLTMEGVTNSTVVIAPAAPVPQVITVSGAQAVYVGKEVIASNKDYNNYRVFYNLNVSLSDGSEYTLENLDVTFPFNKGNQDYTRSFTKVFTLGGQDYTVTFTLTIQ